MKHTTKDNQEKQETVLDCSGQGECIPLVDENEDKMLSFLKKSILKQKRRLQNKLKLLRQRSHFF